LEQIVAKVGAVHFAVRLDVANLYADNLLNFLNVLQARLTNATVTISCGDRKRNKDYRAALFGAKKTDPRRGQPRYALSVQRARAAERETRTRGGGID
jgi:hypothetical protein